MPKIYIFLHGAKSIIIGSIALNKQESFLTSDIMKNIVLEFFLQTKLRNESDSCVNVAQITHFNWSMHVTARYA